MGGHIAKKGNSYYAAVYEGVNTFGTWTDPGDSDVQDHPMAATCTR